MSDRKTFSSPLDQLAGLAQGPARLVIEDWRRFFAEQTHLTRAVCRTVRGAMRAAAEETLKVREASDERHKASEERRKASEVGSLEARLAALEAELTRLRTTRADSE